MLLSHWPSTDARRQAQTAWRTPQADKCRRQHLALSTVHINLPTHLTTAPSRWPSRRTSSEAHQCQPSSWGCCQGHRCRVLLAAAAAGVAAAAARHIPRASPAVFAALLCCSAAASHPLQSSGSLWLPASAAYARVLELTTPAGAGCKAVAMLQVLMLFSHSQWQMRLG